MELLRHYVFSVVAASLISGVIMGFLQGGTVKTLIKVISGLFLAFMVISPIRQLDISDFPIPGTEEASEASSAARLGEELSLDAIKDIIKQQTEAYILDKAAQLNASVEVQVTLSQVSPYPPVSVRLRGEISPYARRQLEAMLSEELGIQREDQQWTG
jgi:hypothetical protein